MNYLNEARGVASIGKITFTYDGEKLKFPIGADESSFRNCYLQIYNWLFDKKYDFKNVKNVFNNNGNFYSKDEVDEIIKSGRYQRRLFQKLVNSDKYLLVAGNKSQYKENLINMLDDFGAEDIKFEGFESENKIKKFGEVDDIELDELDELDELEEPIENKIDNQNSIEKIKVFKKNPFMQAVCVLGSPAAGKSVTSLNVLENSDHESLLVIPTDLSTSMIAQYLFGKLKLNKLGRFLLEAYKNPDKLYTVVIDEFHKPLTIKRVNDELLQAISLQRYNETRFLVGDVADELFLEHLESIPGLSKSDYMFHGNIKIPSNFGFILISSKPNIIIDNDDIYDRVDIVFLERSDIGKINTILDILSRKIHTVEDKQSFKQMIKSEDE